jgi:hypothetical protein
VSINSKDIVAQYVSKYKHHLYGTCIRMWVGESHDQALWHVTAAGLYRVAFAVMWDIFGVRNTLSVLLLVP